MLIPPLLKFFPGIIPSKRDGSFGCNSIFISTPCLLVFKKVKKVLISGIPSKAKILVLVFGTGTSGTSIMIIVFPGDLPPRPGC